jgi:phosphatidylserine decarboxylase
MATTPGIRSSSGSSCPARPFQGDPKFDVNIGCETTPWEYANDLKLENLLDQGRTYSLLDIFGGNPQWAKLFEGGQLYQGFLSATHYHRWRAPLDGRIVRSWVQPGTYFARQPAQGEDQHLGGHGIPALPRPCRSAIFIFEHETCGTVALVCIGMVEVSTCHHAEPIHRGRGRRSREHHTRYRDQASSSAARRT